MSPSRAVALIVDDSAVNRKVLARHLESLDIASCEAENGREALEVLRSGGSDVGVVLLDIVMPEMDGYETLAAIKAHETLRHLPVIMISGVEELDSVVRCIEMGATDYLPKPFDPAILGARIRASLAGKRLHDLEVESAARQAELLHTIELQKEELSRFLSPQVAALVSSPEGAQLLAGHRRLATSVFCDLRGFTPFSEAAEPEEVLGVLREYHKAMGELIVEHGGTLEHFAGDGMMVFFNDPVRQDDHVERAVRMSLAMRDRFEELAAEWSRRGYVLGFGVGIDTGYATLGRIGFEGRYDYGMVGTAVIVASRLSSAATAGQILLSPQSHEYVRDLVEAEGVGEINLKGFSRPIAPVNVLRARPAAASGAGVAVASGASRSDVTA
ncbi:MAG: adenylate/guanylate cyclase domain-containing response regulator [Chloroflexi bacterium]|nr:MAG: adenylate/guanylate cyclase domain-containing response regulator [Chloroflexota bacterium]